MNDIFGDLKKQISTSGINVARIGSIVLFTSKICMLVTTLACVLVTAKNYIGDNINCITGFEKQEHKAIETYCFIASTFTLVDLSTETPHPGVGPIHQGYNEDGEPIEEEQMRHAYYQWVPMVLVLQAVVYYFPLWMWGLMDRGFYQSILIQLDKVHIGDPSGYISKSAKFFSESLTTHRSYALKFLFCEITAFAISVGNLFFTNTFLGGEFFKFGPSALKYLGHDATDLDNPLNEIFPKVAKCTWHKYGASGTIQTFDSMCVLPLNIVNEKTYIFLWVVYIFGAIICGVALLWHLLLLFVPGIRNTILVHRAKKQETKQALLNVLPKCNYGDWFLMYHFKTSMVYFRPWIKKVQEELQK